ncbi:MAG TPA: hypothetical protein VK824_06785 [Planctomycetota bacterium]|nr:hypothetical protein [Planctomycetota bacterium]
MEASRPRSLLRTLGCLLGLALLIVLAIGVAAVMQSSVQVLQGQATDGAGEIAAALARFPGGRPYVDIVRRDGLIATLVHHEREPAHPARIVMLRGLLWDEGPDRLVRASTPAWVLDLARWKTDATAPLLQPIEKRLGLEVSLPDLAPFGPGLIVDHHGAHGRRIVLWAEGD